MSDINNIVNKILEDAKLEKEQILSNAESEKAKIIDSKTLEAKEIEKNIIEKSKEEGTSRKERIISNAKLQVRNRKLEAKQQIIEEVFKNAVEKLADLPEQDFLNYIENRILSLDITGEENLILNANGKKIVNKEFVQNINEKLKAKGKQLKISISNETRDFKGGFILEKNGIEINNTFEALVNSIKEQLEYEVASVLFE